MRFLGAGIGFRVLGGIIALIGAACQSDPKAAESTTPPSNPVVTVERPIVSLNGGTLDVGTHPDVDPGDRIRVDGGLGIVQYPDLLELEAFKGTDVILPDPGQLPDELRIRLNGGHLHVKLDDRTEAAVVVNLGQRTLTTTEPGTEFVVCQAPDGGTCIYVADGGLLWEGDGDPSTYGAGQGTFARPGEAPASPNCPPPGSFSGWLRGSRTEGDMRPLSRFIADYSEASCSDGGATSTTGVPATTIAAAPATTIAHVTDTTTTVPVVASETVPSGRGMAFVTIAEPRIGTEGFADRPTAYIEPRAVEGPVEFYIDREATTNGEFRKWLAFYAGDDAEAWTEHSPAGWLLNAPGGAATQATYADDTSDEPVLGVGGQTAAAYCLQIAKRLPTEIEWELAAVNERLVDFGLPSQDWVSEWDDYGEGVPAGRRVLRGTDGAADQDPHYRLMVEDSPDATVARARAGVRCAADEVDAADEVESVTAGTPVYEDDFRRDDSGWPSAESQGFRLGYHAPHHFHVEPNEKHRSVVVLHGEEPLGAATVETSVFVEKTEGAGNYRYGLAAGSRDGGFILFTIQPREGGDQYDWCVQTMGEAISTDLETTGAQSVSHSPGDTPAGHEGERCLEGLASGTVPVGSSPNTMTIEAFADGVGVAVDDTHLATIDTVVPVHEYGFFVQTYHMDLAHIHYDTIKVATP